MSEAAAGLIVMAVEAASNAILTDYLPLARRQIASCFNHRRGFRQGRTIPLLIKRKAELTRALAIALEDG
jgi:hypothetical protein